MGRGEPKLYYAGIFFWGEVLKIATDLRVFRILRAWHISSRNFPFATHGPIDNDVPSIPRNDFLGNFQALKGPVFMEVFFDVEVNINHF